MAKARKRTKSITVDNLTARSIQIQDEKGRLRAYVLACGDTVHFNLCAENGLPRLTLSLDPNGEPHIVLYGHNKNPAVSLGATNDGQAGVSVYNINEPRDRMRLGIQKPGRPHAPTEIKACILVTGANGSVQIEAPEAPSKKVSTRRKGDDAGG